jgi:hypothetical protein
MLLASWSSSGASHSPVGHAKGEPPVATSPRLMPQGRERDQSAVLAHMTAQFELSGLEVDLRDFRRAIDV